MLAAALARKSGTLAQSFAAGALYAWSAMVPALQENFDVGVKQAGFVFSLSIVGFTVAVLAFPHLRERLPRIGNAAFFCVFGAVALVAAALSWGFYPFAISYGLGFGVASGAIYAACLQDVAFETPEEANILTGCVVAAFGLGGAVFGPALRLLVAYGLGLQALFAPAFCLLVVGLLTGVMAGMLAANHSVQDRPLEKGARQEVPASATISGGVLVGLLWCGFAFGSASGLMTIGLASVMIEDAGGAVALSSAALAAIALANSAGRLTAGFLTRIVGLSALLLLGPSLALAGFAVIALSDGPVALAIALTIVAGTYGLVASTYPIITRSLFGADSFGRRYGVIFTAWGVAGLISPWLAGALFDWTGEFDHALSAGAFAAALALAFAIAICRRAQRALSWRKSH